MMTPSPTRTVFTTATGAQVDLARIDKRSIRVDDIATSLSRQPYRGGHTSRLISYAEVSLLVCDVLERDMRVSHPSYLLVGLLSHAARAYVFEPSQLDKLGGVHKAILRRYDLAQAHLFTAIKTLMANAVVQKTIQRDLSCSRQVGSGMDALAHEPSHLPDAPAIEWINLHSDHQAHWSADDWRQTFIERFDELTFKEQGPTGLDTPGTQESDI